VDPVTGNKKKWSEWADNGGLKKLNDFYGLEISRVDVGWRDDRITGLVMWTSQSHSPKDVRKAMTKICGGSDQDWKLVSNFSGKVGTYESPTVMCRYSHDEVNWELLYLRKE